MYKTRKTAEKRAQESANRDSCAIFVWYDYGLGAWVTTDRPPSSAPFQTFHSKAYIESRTAR